MKEKYIEERFPRWFVFGEDGYGHVDLSDGDDVIQGVSWETASKLMLARDDYVNALINVFTADPDALYKLVGNSTR